MPPQESLPSNLKTSVLDRIEDVGVAGVKEARHSFWAKRLFYTLVVVLFLLFAILHTVVTVKKALDSSTSTSVTHGYTNDISLPDLTFCNRYTKFINESKLAHNYFKRFPNVTANVFTNTNKQLQIDDIDLEEWISLQLIMPFWKNNILGRKNTATRVLGLPKINIANAIDRLHKRFDGIESIASVYKKATSKYVIPCDKTFIKCSLGSQKFNCCSSGFMTLSNTIIGPCWTTNMAVALNHTSAEYKRDRLWITMKHFADPLPDADQASLLMLLVRLGKQQWVPEGGNTFYAYNFAETSFGLTAKKIVDMPNKGSCAHENTRLQLFDTYSSEHCSAERFMIDANSRAPCKIHALEVFNPTFFESQPKINQESSRDYCPILETTHNSTSFRPLPLHINVENVKTDVTDCPNLCKRVDYAFSIVRDVHHKSYGANNNTIMSFRFTDNRYIIYEQVQTLAWYDYLSLVGGIWGIWIGSSLITLIQVFEIPVSLCVWKANQVVATPGTEMRQGNL